MIDMKRIFLFTFLVFLIQNSQAEIYSCTDVNKNGIGFDDQAKQAWQISHSMRQNAEIKIVPEDFKKYRCTGCYSFDGVMKINDQEVLSNARTYYSSVDNQMWMQYDQKGAPEQSFELMLKCNLVEIE
jgi:hypothetical protein